MSDYRRIADAIRYLDANAAEQPDLAALAERLGLGPHHAHKLFKRWAGVTPKDFLQALTLTRAKALLAGGEAVLEASLGVGLSGGARLHDLFVTLEGMTPGAYKARGKGITIAWAVHETPLGNAVIATTERAVCAVHFLEDHEAPEAVLQARWPLATLAEDARKTKTVAQALEARLRGEPPDVPLALAPVGTAFQLKVWDALLRVPEGAVTTYGALARHVGLPTGSRAIGNAVGANPIAILIPCHRVIRTSGALGDYRWGLGRKEQLLAAERARVTTRA